MSAKRAKRLRREARERRQEREAAALAWEWRSDGPEGRTARYGEPYLHWDGNTYWRTEDGVERYAFNVWAGVELVGSSVVEIHPWRLIPKLRSDTRKADVDLSLVGPCLHPRTSEDEDVTFMTSLAILPGASPRTIFALMAPIERLGLPTYAQVHNKAVAPLLRRYPVLQRESAP